MTCIAWDGTTLAADRLASNGGTKCEVTKIHRVGPLLVGGAGDVPFIQEMIDWIRKGRIPADFPAAQRTKEDWMPILVIEPDGVALVYERTPYPSRFEQKHVAIGSGREYARAAMHLGFTAAQAVQCAIDIDTTCGIGIDTLETLYEDTPLKPGMLGYGRG